MPPLKGIIVDPEYPPTAEEAAHALRKHDRVFSAPASQQPEPQDFTKGRRGGTATAPDRSRGAKSQESLGEQAKDDVVDPYRKSGTSDILGRSATTDEVINEMPGGTRHTAGGEQMKDVGVTDIIKNLSFEDFKNVHKIPCFRESWLYGIGAGFLVAGALWTVGKRGPTISNGLFGSTLGVSAVQFTWCNSSRQREKRQVKMVKEVWEGKKEEKREQWEKFKEKKKHERLEREAKEQSRKTWSGWLSSIQSGTTGPRGREG